MTTRRKKKWFKRLELIPKAKGFAPIIAEKIPYGVLIGEFGIHPNPILSVAMMNSLCKWWLNRPKVGKK